MINLHVSETKTEMISQTNDTIRAVPFLKWAGGKRWLIGSLQKASISLPPFKRYIEPFLGSGAFFFYLCPDDSILSDTNEELINTYSAIRQSWEQVVELLHHHQLNHSKSYYYKVRATLPSDMVERAGRFIYLNRTCWNALYRVNRQGNFNVPIGTKSSVIMANDNFQLTSNLLKNAKILAQDFEKTIELSEEGDLLYIDPPYSAPISNGQFVKYNSTIFSWEDQLRLFKALVRARMRGTEIAVSNVNIPEIRSLYDGFGQIYTMKRSTVIASNRTKRGVTTELFIRTW